MSNICYQNLKRIFSHRIPHFNATQSGFNSVKSDLKNILNVGFAIFKLCDFIKTI